MDILFLCTDAFGGRGGIAKFNRDLCNALTAEPLSARVVAFPRLAPVDDLGDLPDGLAYRTDAAGSKLQYVWHLLRSVYQSTVGSQRSTFDPIFDPDLVLCGHVNLLPVAALAAWMQGAPLWLIVHGIDVWEPHPSPLVRMALSYVDRFVSVSQHTVDRFVEWAPVTPDQGHVIPDCIDPDPYGPGPKPEYLLDRYDLHDRSILLTLSRLSAAEQYKGHDEVLEVLPDLADTVPDVAYVICGDGDDRSRLEEKARQLGVNDRVVFAGYVPEDEKADHYRLADTFVMPGRGEGFGIVYLEAMACGIPVVASSADASAEAVRHGLLGEVVDPDDPGDVERGIRRSLNAERGVPDGLEYFLADRFRERWHAFVQTALSSD